MVQFRQRRPDPCALPALREPSRFWVTAILMTPFVHRNNQEECGLQLPKTYVDMLRGFAVLLGGRAIDWQGHLAGTAQIIEQIAHFLIS
jgi:hypothetical protein